MELDRTNTSCGRTAVLGWGRRDREAEEGPAEVKLDTEIKGICVLESPGVVSGMGEGRKWGGVRLSGGGELRREWVYHRSLR